MRIGKKPILFVSIAVLLVFNLGLLLTQHSFGWVQLIIGLPIIFLLPGFLSLHLLGLDRINLKAVLLVIGTSLLELILTGLIANYLPQLFGSRTPLHGSAILITLDCLLIFLITLISLRNSARLYIPKVNFSKWDILIILLSVLTVILSVFGAFLLNNGGSDILTMLSLTLGIVLIILVGMLRQRLSTFCMVFVMFCVGLSVLLMTSLRSWSITGHDVKSEFRVYTLTNQLGRWSINNYVNAYNACLSITILPVVLTKLLHVSGLVVFKFIFQLLFALSPVCLFVLIRNYTSRILAFLGAMLFISYPTFTTDSTMLTRQEIAFVFFGLLLIVWFAHEEPWLKKRWRQLFLLMSAGIILSHYSTTYTYVAMLVMVYVFSRILEFWGGNRKSITKSKDHKLSVGLVVSIVLGAFLWYAQTTQVSGNLTGALINSISNVGNLLKQDNRNADVNYVFTGLSSSPTGLLTTYINDTKSNTHVNTTQAINSLHFLPNDISSSSFDKHVSSFIHIDISSIMSNLYYQIGPKLYQIFIALGVILFLFRKNLKKKSKQIPNEYIALCIAGCIILGLEIILPNISLDYGLMRALQQDLMFLILPIVIFIYFITEKIHQGLGLFAVIIYILFNFCIYTNFLPQISGGIPAQLNLNNSGPYYGAYYVHESDRLMFSWADSHVPHDTTVSASDFATAIEYNPAYPFTKIDGILPFQVAENNYVFLQYEQVVNHTAYISVSGKLLPVGYDMTHTYRDTIYSDGGSQVLK